MCNHTRVRCYLISLCPSVLCSAPAGEFAVVNNILTSKVLPARVGFLIDDFCCYTLTITWWLSNLLFWPLLNTGGELIVGAIEIAYFAGNLLRVWWNWKHEKKGMADALRASVEHKHTQHIAQAAESSGGEATVISRLCHPCYVCIGSFAACTRGSSTSTSCLAACPSSLDRLRHAPQQQHRQRLLPQPTERACSTFSSIAHSPFACIAPHVASARVR